MENEIQFLRTSDINLAATLLSLGYDVNGIDPTSPGRVSFFFKNSPELSRDVESYWADKALVNPKLYMYHRKELLNRINRNDIVN